MAAHCHFPRWKADAETADNGRAHSRQNSARMISRELQTPAMTGLFASIAPPRKNPPPRPSKAQCLYRQRDAVAMRPMIGWAKMLQTWVGWGAKLFQGKSIAPFSLNWTKKLK